MTSAQDLYQFKEDLFGQFGRLGRALSSPRRLELVDLLCQAERTVDDLARETNLTPSNVSQHLAVLRDARLVTSRKDGQFVFYQLADLLVSDFWRLFRRVVMQRMAEAREIVNSHLRESDDAEPVGLDELRVRIKQGDVVVLDVRPEIEYSAGHIPGALSIPLGELERRLDEIPPEREVIAYCRGPYCVMAHEAVKLLRGKRVSARRTTEGMPEWRASGFPVETKSAE